MKVVSVNVGRVASIAWEGRSVVTAFRKRPAPGRVRLVGVNLEGDAQADQERHGGERKSVYVYPSEHYPWWSTELGVSDLAWGSFGENLTVVGWSESDARIGDRVRIGTAELVVTQPRNPCYKLEASFGRNDMIRRFHDSGRSGFYLGRVRDGELGAGDPVTLLHSDPTAPTVADVVARARASAET